MNKYIIYNYLIRTSIWAFILTLLLLTVQFKGSNQIEIKSINVPALLKEGQADYVILDCDFELGNSSSDGLAVKWYFNDDNEYQWLYGYEPRAVSDTSNIDLAYKASNDPYTMYRAMKLNNPTINMTGDYRCVVFNYRDDEDTADASMIVYATEEKFDLKYRKKIIDGKEGVELTCFAEGLYPQPTMDIFVNDVILNDTISSDLTMRNDSKYDIMLQVVAKNEDLPSEALVKCSLSIPQANYTIPRELIYMPGTPTSTPSVTTNLLRKMEILAINSSEPDNTDNGGGGGAASKSLHSLTLLFIITLFTSICYH